MADTTKPSGKKRAFSPGAWQEARALVYQHRGRLAVGLGLLLVNRLAGLVLPSSSKWVIDRVINQHHAELLVPLAVAAGAATLIQAITGFGLSQILGVAAQRAITDMRRTVQAYVLRLPVGYFDSTKSGILISRIMSDAEGIRNLVGTGLVQLVGGLVTAVIALGVLFYLNWRLTVFAILILGLFGGGMAYAFTKLRPLFRERGKINAEVTGRLGETLGGIRIVKAYRAERGERLVFTRGAHSLFRNVATTMTGISALGAFASIIVGAIGILMILEGGHAILSGSMTLGDFFMYGVFVGLVALPLINIASIGTQITEAFAGLDRIRGIRRLATEDAEDLGEPEPRDRLDQRRRAGRDGERHEQLGVMLVDDPVDHPLRGRRQYEAREAVHEEQPQPHGQPAAVLVHERPRLLPGAGAERPLLCGRLRGVGHEVLQSNPGGPPFCPSSRRGRGPRHRAAPARLCRRRDRRRRRDSP